MELQGPAPFSHWGHSGYRLKRKKRASLVAQWLRIRLPMQGTWVQALVWNTMEQLSLCAITTEPGCHNYWRLATTRESPRAAKKTQCSHKKINLFFKKGRRKLDYKSGASKSFWKRELKFLWRTICPSVSQNFFPLNDNNSKYYVLSSYVSGTV